MKDGIVLMVLMRASPSLNCARSITSNNQTLPVNHVKIE
jgi:hypothetical protein